MRLQIFSDLHADVAAVRPITLRPDADAVVVAGDVCEDMEIGLPLLRRLVPHPVPIIFVAGNHEFYGLHLERHLTRARVVAAELGITLLENDAAVLDGVRFIGATLWTDYDLDGPDGRDRAMAAAAHAMSDHGWIRVGPKERPFTPADARMRHLRSRAFIEAALAAGHDGPTVVVTHHLPHPSSIHPAYARSPVNPAFASDLSQLIETAGPRLWVHGHTHKSRDYSTGRTRIVCNPHGYGLENPEFDPALVVEVGGRP